MAGGYMWLLFSWSLTTVHVGHVTGRWSPGGGSASPHPGGHPSLRLPSTSSNTTPRPPHAPALPAPAPPLAGGPHIVIQRHKASQQSHPPSSPGSTVLRMARTRPRGEPKRKKSDTSKSKRPRPTSGGGSPWATGGSASSFSTFEWMLPGEETRSGSVCTCGCAGGGGGAHVHRLPES